MGKLCGVVIPFTARLKVNELRGAKQKEPRLCKAATDARHTWHMLLRFLMHPTKHTMKKEHMSLQDS